MTCDLESIFSKNNKRVYIIAEMSANHGGDLQCAIETIYAAKEAGADFIKIQSYTEDTMTIDCDKEYFKIKEGIWEGEKLYDLYKNAKTPWQWQEILKKEADKVKIDFLATAFDKSSVDFLENIGIEVYKIASFEITDIPLIKYIASKKKPIILSTGNASLEEIQEAITAIRIYHDNFALLKCSSSYPAQFKDMNLKTIEDLGKRFKCIVGLSDHSLGSVSALCGVSLGARIIEKHFCLNKSIKSPDISFSMDFEEFKLMVQDIRKAEEAIGKVNYSMSPREKGNLSFRRSIFAIEDIKKGEELTCENIRVIRPSFGLAPKFYEEVLGKRALRDIERGTPLTFDMICLE